jgi:hypothetical protein
MRLQTRAMKTGARKRKRKPLYSPKCLEKEDFSEVHIQHLA